MIKVNYLTIFLFNYDVSKYYFLRIHNNYCFKTASSHGQHRQTDRWLAQELKYDMKWAEKVLYKR